MRKTLFMPYFLSSLSNCFCISLLISKSYYKMKYIQYMSSTRTTLYIASLLLSYGAKTTKQNSSIEY